MRRRALPLLVLLLPLLIVPTAAAKEATARYRYTGWKCAACAGKVEKAARSIKGVNKATATLDVVTIVYDDEKADLSTLALEGFTFAPLTTGTAH